MIGGPGAVTARDCADGRLEVLDADPRIWIGLDLVTELAAGRHHRDVRFDVQRDSATDFTGAVFTIDGRNRRVVYVLREYLPGPGCWLAEWPD